MQEVAYALSDKIFSYSPESFDLDVAARDWANSNTPNAHGYTTQVASLQTRSGAGAIALGYIFSKDFDLSKRHIPQTLLGSSASLHSLRSALDQLSLLYSVANPFVAHIAALEYGSSRLVTDYVTALDVAEVLGIGLVCSTSAYEAQHMALFSTLLASVLPTIHTYDVITVGRDTLRVIDVLSQTGLANAYDNILAETSKFGKKADVEGKIIHLLESFNSELGTAYGLFEYHGHSAAEFVFVVFGSVEASVASQVAEKLASEGLKIGVINVRVYRPFVEEVFLKAVPSTARSIIVFGQVMDQIDVVDGSIHSSLYEDVLAAAMFSNEFTAAPRIIDHKYPREAVFTPSLIAAIIRGSLGGTEDILQPPSLLYEQQIEQYIFWDVEDSEAATAPAAISKYLSLDSKSNVYLNQTHDNLVLGGIVRTDIRISKKSIEASYPIDTAEVAFIGDEKLLKDLDVITSIKDGGKIIIKLQGVKDEDLEKRLPTYVRQAIKNRGIECFAFDPSLCGLTEQEPSIETVLAELVFIQVTGSDTLGSAIQKLASINANAELLQSAKDDLQNVLRKIEVPDSWAEGEEDKEFHNLPRRINTCSFTGFEKEDIEPPSLLRTWQSAAKALLFRESYATQSSLRPDLPVKTYELTVQENRRLTPITYDRNIFHIEFDIGSSGLKYEIGEALGIHAENPVGEVEDFLSWYGLEPEAIVELPSRDDPSILETRTIFQHLIHNIDIFGKPPKRFYEALAEFAVDANEKKELLTLGGPEGGGEFKRRAEVDTITYSDILHEFPSAHPPFHSLARLIAPLKRREYSIASSQAVTPHSIALMIVVVSWVDPKGRDRFGQATKYLSILRPGSKVTVSVKPSVMKLPPTSTTPLILAGLGTGLAPFRAFIQYRALQKSQGLPIGPILLYMGSRHQREEYLYGEEWEAYLASGVITLLGRAFSRDQEQKIYIQDRMRESMGEVVEAWVRGEGSFYLCGPTWPVPDVQGVLEEVLRREKAGRNGGGSGKRDFAKKEIERLKEGGRYVLEVY